MVKVVEIIKKRKVNPLHSSPKVRYSQEVETNGGDKMKEKLQSILDKAVQSIRNVPLGSYCWRGKQEIYANGFECV